MIGLVLVSHSTEIAAGAKKLAEQMSDGSLAVVAAGGTLDTDGISQLGTDVFRIVAAIQEVWSEAGVLLLMDLGSSVLSAEMALEMLPPEIGRRCLLSNAPLVEGAVVAALHATLNCSLEEVNAAAEEAATHLKVWRPSKESC